MIPYFSTIFVPFKHPEFVRVTLRDNLTMAQSDVVRAYHETAERFQEEFDYLPEIRGVTFPDRVRLYIDWINSAMTIGSGEFGYTIRKGFTDLEMTRIDCAPFDLFERIRVYADAFPEFEFSELKTKEAIDG